MEGNESGAQSQEPRDLLIGRAEPLRATEAPKQTNEVRNAGVAVAAAREITNVGVLDLSAMESPDTLDGVRQITNVGVILVPQPLVQKLSTIPQTNIGSTISIPAGARLKTFTGDAVLSGESLANPDGKDGDVLIVTGNLIFTTPVTKVGYEHFIVTGEVVAPEGSEAALGAGITRLTGDLSFYPYRDNAYVRVRMGFQQLTGRDLANPSGQETDILLVVGTLGLTGPIDTLGFQHVVVVGTLVAPPGSDEVLGGRVTTVGGQIIYSAARPRVFEGRDELSGAFFEYLDEPILLIIHGRCTFEDDVTPEVLKQKLGGIILNGRIIAPRHVVPLIQALTLMKSGRISVSDDRDRDRDRKRD